MRGKLLRPESMLLLFVVALPLFLGVITAHSGFDIFLRDKFRMRPVFFSVYFVCLIGACHTWVLNNRLRHTHKIQPVISGIHVIVSFALILWVIDDFYYHLPLKAMMLDLPPVSSVRYCSITNNIAQQSFVAWQLLFTIYSCLRLLVRRKRPGVFIHKE